MKIDFYISSLSGGGAEKILVNLANKFSALGNDVSIISLEKREQFYSPHKNVATIKVRNSGWLAPLKDFLHIHAILKQRKADVVISFLCRCNLLVLLASLFVKQKVIVSDRNNPLKEHSRLVFFIQNAIYLRSDRIIVQTNAIKKYYWKMLQNRIEVIENPIDIQSLDAQIETPVKREKVILSIGRLEPQKDFKTLIYAFYKVHKVHRDWIVKIFGYGNMESELKEIVGELGLEDKIIFCGRTERPYLEMRKASIFVLSSFYEGFPNVLCEAMYAGDLCIASDCISGPRELIDNRENGWLFDIGNIEQLADIIEECIEHEENLEAVRTRAEASVRRLYIEENILKWEAAVRAVVEL